MYLPVIETVTRRPDSFIRPGFISKGATVTALPEAGFLRDPQEVMETSTIRLRKEPQICWSMCECQEEIPLFVFHPQCITSFAL